MRGACGLDERELDETEVACKVDEVGVGGATLIIEGVNGSFVISGNEAS